MELADVQPNEVDTGVSPADIPGGEAAPAPDSNNGSDKPLSLREQINKSVEAVRTEEAKRARDVATGKFTKKPDAEIQAGADAPAAADEKPATEQNAQPKDSKPVGPPSGWSKEAQALWETLPEAVKADAVRREAEVAKGFDEYRGKVKQFEAIEQVLAPARARFQQQGVTNDAEALRNILSWEASLANPATRIEAFTGLARQLQIDLSTLAQNSSQAPSAVPQDIPESLRPVLDQFGRVIQDVTQIKTDLQRSQEDRIASEIQSFAKDKPHFEKVRVLMGQLMSAGIVPPNDLAGAYQRAIAIDPEVSAAIKADEDAKRAEELRKQQAAKASSARLAAASPAQRAPAGSPNGAAPAAKKGVRESIMASVSQLREEQRA